MVDTGRMKWLAITLLLIWMLFNFVQAAYLELDPDEAYYWLYSRQLDWGYFDHPPAVALMIKAGYALFPSELGVRLGAVLLQAAGFVLLWDLLGRPLEKEKWRILAMLLAGLPMLQVYGFIATPDSPLLFFVIAFFYIYDRFLQNAGWRNTLLLGGMMALMLYSKYHGVLVIFFTLLSNIRLLLHPRFYMASVFGALLFFPHLYWQWEQGFPTFSYHLVGRDDPYELKHTVTYLVNQIAILSPFLFPLFLIVLLRRKPQDALERAFYYVIYGFWIFFFFSTFKGHAEPQWTAVISIPLLILAYRHALFFPRFAVWLRRMAIVTIGLLLAARLFLLFGGSLLPPDFQDRRWISRLQDRAGDLPVIFENSYRDVSKYAFYTGDRAYTFTDVKYRKNQFDIWNWEEKLHGRAVLMVGKKEWDCEECERFRHFNKDFKLLEVPELIVAQKLRVNWAQKPLDRLIPGKEYAIELEFANPYDHSIALGEGVLPVEPVVFLLDNGVYVDAIPLSIGRRQIPAKANVREAASFRVPMEEDWELLPSQIGLGIRMDSLPPVVNTPVAKVMVTSGGQ